MINSYCIKIAQDAFALMFDYSINVCQINPDRFSRYFLESDVLQRFEENDIGFLAGHSGIEFAEMIIPKRYIKQADYKDFIRTKEYWAGYALAYFWMKSFYKIEEILNKISLREIIELYHPYHEMDLSHFYEFMMKTMDRNRLKIFRKKNNLSQNELSLLSNVPLKTIQKYETKERLLCKASGEILIRLSRALNCSIEDLIL